ncbi:MAG TPA: choice-of-anchor Q domain-containing protein [Flavipsychrobacter sp.]|nr:choice-of-anchor Q domain-containing protein [Flavipsychrobacter sp.]
MQKIIYLITVICCLSINYNGYGTIRYVKTIAAGSGNGSSWSNASNDLQLMIDSSSTGDEVWVASGNYKPTRLVTNTSTISFNNRQNAFVLKSGVTVLGGYFGTGIFANLRAPQIYTTELDGDIGTLNDSTDNTYHVVVALSGGCTVDGFVIKNGNASNSSTTYVGGIFMANNQGAGVYVNTSGFTIRNCWLQANNSSEGAMKIVGSGTIEHCYFNNNTGLRTALDCYGNIHVRNTLFSGNSGLFGPVGLTNSVIRFYNCIFSGNNVNVNYGSSGGMSSLIGGNAFWPSNVDIVNCVFSGNKFNTSFVKVLSRNEGSLSISNSIIWGNAEITSPIYSNATIAGTIAVSNSIVQGGYTGTDNLNIDPLFVNAPPQVNAPFATGDYHIAKCSPAINGGNNNYLLAADVNDLDGKKRISGRIDIGAYEYSLGVPDVTGVVYVDSSAAPGGDGSSWSNAIIELADALKAAKYDTAIHKIHVAAGTYKPLYTADSLLCNSNNNRKKSFVIPDRVWVMGGYVNGQITYSSGNPQNPSILSGDIGTANNNSDNSYHVVIAAGTNNINTRLYNFIVEKGETDFNAPSMTVNGISISGVSGSGMANQANAYGSSTTNKGADIMYCIFRNNSGYYGALSNILCNNVLVFGTSVINDSAGFGGGMANLGPGNVTVDHCKISGNEALFYGGGIYTNRCKLNVHTSLITGNYSHNDGGGIHSDSSTVFIGNSTIANNKAVYNFGGFNHYYATGAPVATITNSIIWGNNSSIFYNIDTTNNPQLLVNNSIVMGQTYNFGTNMIKMTPNFINPIFTTNAPSDGGDYHLSVCSPAINAGVNSNFVSPYMSDLDGNTRINQNKIDLGAYENAGYSLSQTPSDSLVNTNFNNSCNYSDFVYPNTTLPPWQNLSNASGKLIVSIKQPPSMPINSTVYPANFSSKLRTQYGTGTTLQLSNPFGQTGYYYPINRTWTATINGSLSAPVSVRFYFDNTDSTDIAAQNNFGNLQNLIVYKVNGTDPYNTSASAYKEYTYAAVADTGHFSIGTYQGLRFVEFIVMSLSSGTIALKKTSPLDIKIENIAVANVGPKNRLDWNTLTKDETDVFIVERSDDGKNFEKLEKIAARGESSSYTFWDEKPFSGVNYYRIKMQDINGKLTYSRVVEAFVTEDAYAIDVFPNPFTDKIHVDRGDNNKCSGFISINDITGRELIRQQVQSGNVVVQTSFLSKGLYILRYCCADRQFDIKIFKQ